MTRIDNTSRRILPASLRATAAREPSVRRGLLDRWPVAGPVLCLPLMARSLSVPEARLTLVGIEPAAGIGADVPLAVAVLTTGDGRRVVLGVPLTMARASVGLALGREPADAKARLATGEEGVLLYVLDRAAGDWLEAGGSRFEIRGLLGDSISAEALIPGGEVWRVSGHLALGDLEGPVWLWCAAEDPQPRRLGTMPDPLPDTAAAWPVEIAVEAGGSAISPASLGDLAAGDIVILDRLAHPGGSTGGGCARLVSGAYSRAVRWLDATRLEVVSSIEGGQAMAKDRDGGEPVRARTVTVEGGAGTPEVQVLVEVARVRMSVGDALGLLPGRIVELDRPVGADVVLRVGDGRVAAGVLVEHEGELAVEITEVP